MNNFTTVTEISGDDISSEQVERMVHRYQWAQKLSNGKDVIEVGCGTGQGLGLLLQSSNSVEGGDYSNELLSIASEYYQDRLPLKQFDAQDMPYDDNSKEVIILFETIYYVPDAQNFVEECARVLKPGGLVLIASANKELKDFNPSPFSYKYFNCVELQNLFNQHNFNTKFYGYMPISKSTIKSKIISFIKKTAVTFNLMPKTMAGKKFLKRFVFGKLVPMPYEITGKEYEYIDPIKINENFQNEPDFKVIYCEAQLK